MTTRLAAELVTPLLERIRREGQELRRGGLAGSIPSCIWIGEFSSLDQAPTTELPETPLLGCWQVHLDGPNTEVTTWAFARLIDLMYQHRPVAAAYGAIAPHPDGIYLARQWGPRCGRGELLHEDRDARLIWVS